jgi:hypothetical protein
MGGVEGMSRRHWPDVNDFAIVAGAIALVRWIIRRDKREGGWNPPKAKILPFIINEQDSILKQGQQQAGELAATITTDGERVDGEVSLTAGGQSWLAKFWAKVTAREQAKPDVSAGVEFQKRWFGGW